MSAWRHARAILLLPGTVVVLVPTLILTLSGAVIGWGGDGFAVLPVLPVPPIREIWAKRAVP